MTEAAATLSSSEMNKMGYRDRACIKPSVIRDLNEETVRGLSPRTLDGLISTQLSQLNLGYLTADQINNLGIYTIEAFSISQISAIRGEVQAKLDVATINRFTKSQLRVLNPKFLTAVQLNGLDHY